MYMVLFEFQSCSVIIPKVPLMNHASWLTCLTRLFIALHKREYQVNNFLFLHKYVPQCGASYEYPQPMFLWRNKKNTNTVDSCYLDLAYLT